MTAAYRAALRRDRARWVGDHPYDRAILSLVLPAYNEAKRLRATLLACEEHVRRAFAKGEILVVDDGSIDETARIADQLARELTDSSVSIRCLRLTHRGKGAAVREGMLAASGETIAFLDADLSIPIGLLDDLVAAIDAGSDIAVASRYLPGSVVQRPLLRRAMSHAYRFLVGALVPTGLSDTQCGGKAYTARAARSLFSVQRLDGFAFDAEVLFVARLAGFRVTEVPFALVQPRHTSIHLLRDVPRMVRDLIRIRWWELRGAYATCSSSLPTISG